MTRKFSSLFTPLFSLASSSLPSLQRRPQEAPALWAWELGCLGEKKWF